jgi:hypothetical protein
VCTARFSQDSTENLSGPAKLCDLNRGKELFKAGEAREPQLLQKLDRDGSCAEPQAGVTFSTEYCVNFGGLASRVQKGFQPWKPNLQTDLARDS